MILRLTMETEYESSDQTNKISLPTKHQETKGLNWGQKGIAHYSKHLIYFYAQIVPSSS